MRLDELTTPRAFKFDQVKCSLLHYMKSSDAKASKCHLKFSSRMIIFIKLV